MKTLSMSVFDASGSPIWTDRDRVSANPPFNRSQIAAVEVLNGDENSVADDDHLAHFRDTVRVGQLGQVDRAAGFSGGWVDDHYRRHFIAGDVGFG